MLYLLFFVSLLVSLLGTIAGFGGGVFIVPFLTIVMHVPIEIAIGVTACSLFPSSLLSTFFNLKGDLIDFRLAILLEVPTIIGAMLGATLTEYIPIKSLEVIFGLFLLFLSWKNFRPSHSGGGVAKLIKKLNSKGHLVKCKHETIGLYSASVFGVMAGAIAGLFGIGGGVLKTPIMINVFKIPPKVATSTALFMIVFTSFFSGITHYRLGHVDLDLLLWVGLGFVTGSFIGNMLGLKTKDQTVKKVIAFSIGLAGVIVGIRSLITHF